MIAPLFDMFTGAMFIFSCEIPIYVQTKNRLAHLDQDFTKVGYQACRAGWGWWMQADLVPSDQEFSCKWNFSFFKAVPSNRLSFYLGSPLHIISSLFSHFCLFQNAILHKMLKLGFWNFKPIFLRMQFSLVATFFLYFWLSVWVEICILNFLMSFQHLYHLTFGDKSVRVLDFHIWN